MTISKQDFLDRAKLDSNTLDVWIEEEWLVPSGTMTEQIFSEADLARAKLIRELFESGRRSWRPNRYGKYSLSRTETVCDLQSVFIRILGVGVLRRLSMWALARRRARAVADPVGC